MSYFWGNPIRKGKPSNRAKIIFLGAVFVSLLFLVGIGDSQAEVSGTSTPQITPFPQNKVKEDYIFPALKIELTRNSTDTLAKIDVQISTTTNATPTALTSSSFNWIAVASSTDGQYGPGDTILATTTPNIGSTTTLNLPPGIDAQGIFFIVLNTASTSTFTDNGYPDTGGAVGQKFTASTLAMDTVLSGVTTTNSSPPFTTTTQEFIADTHSQLPATSTLRAFYQNGNYYLQEQSGQTLGEQGTTTLYADNTTTTPLGISALSPDGHPAGWPFSLGSQYRSSVWLDLVDILGHATSTRVEFPLPLLPQITSIKAFTDRIIFNTSENLDGGQATICSNYTVAGSTLNCAGPGYPFIDFFGNRVVIRGLNLTSGSQISFSVSDIQDINPERFPLSYSTSTLLVQTAAIPTISSISPRATTTGATVTISGSNFGTATGTLMFSVSPTTGPLPPVEASTTAWSDTSITATVPSGAQSGPVDVITSDGIMSDPNENSFFDVFTNVYFKIVNTTTTQPVTTSTNMRIFVGSPLGENIYFVNDTQGTTFDDSTYVYTVPNISTMGFTWAYDASGIYLPSMGMPLQTNTSSTNPQVLTLNGTTTKSVSGTITLGTSCTSDGQNKWIAVMAMPEGVETAPGPGGGIFPSFFRTNTSC